MERERPADHDQTLAEKTYGGTMLQYLELVSEVLALEINDDGSPPLM